MSWFSGKHTTQQEDVAVNHSGSSCIRKAIERLESVIEDMEKDHRKNEEEIRDLKARLADAQDTISRIQT